MATVKFERDSLQETLNNSLNSYDIPVSLQLNMTYDSQWKQKGYLSPGVFEFFPQDDPCSFCLFACLCEWKQAKNTHWVTW